MQTTTQPIAAENPAIHDPLPSQDFRSLKDFGSLSRNQPVLRLEFFRMMAAVLSCWSPFGTGPLREPQSPGLLRAVYAASREPQAARQIVVPRQPDFAESPLADFADPGVARLGSAPARRSFGILAERLSFAAECEPSGIPKGCVQSTKAPSSRSTPKLLLLAGELQVALADGFAEGLVRREGGEWFGPPLA